MNSANDNRLKSLRLARGLTQKALAEGSGVYIRQIQKIEAGEIMPENLTLSNALKIADCLDVDPHELVKSWE